MNPAPASRALQRSAASEARAADNDEANQGAPVSSARSRAWRAPRLRGGSPATVSATSSAAASAWRQRRSAP
jgi:hypothetical protein